MNTVSKTLLRNIIIILYSSHDIISLGVPQRSNSREPGFHYHCSMWMNTVCLCGYNASRMFQYISVYRALLECLVIDLVGIP